MTTNVRAEHPGRSTRLTSRGLAMGIAGMLLLGIGTLFGLITLVLAGAVLILPPLMGWLSMRMSSLESGWNPLFLSRYAAPNPTAVGSNIKVIAVIHARKPNGRGASKLHSLSLSARTPQGLGSGLPLRAQFSSEFASIQLTYSLVPSHRGQWPLGPLFATRSDVFGVARSRARFSDDTTIRVWPAVLPLFRNSDRRATGLVPSRLGATDPSNEDSALRTYQPGDDLRRVHWVSAAKHNEMMVRTSEGASLPPVAVLLDLVPLQPDAARLANTPASALGEVTEWAVSTAASLSLHLLDAGHATRFVSTERGREQPAFQAAASASGAAWIRPSDDDAHVLILDQLIPVAVPELTSETVENRRDVIEHLAGQTTNSETLICVLTPPETDQIDLCLAALRAAGHMGSNKIAFIAVTDEPDLGGDVAVRLRDGLIAAGWRAVLVPSGSDLEIAWWEAMGANR